MKSLLLLLAFSAGTGVGVGLLARMPAREIVGQCAVMCAVAAGFWGLVAIL